MKKLVYIFAVLFLGITSATAQKLVIEDCDAYVGAVTTIPVKYVTEGAKCGGGQLNIELPKGLSLVMTTEENEEGEEVEIADAERGAETQDFTLVTSTNGFAVFGTKNLPGEEGTLLKFKIKADADLEIGTQLTCRVYNVAVPTTNGNVKKDDFTFVVTIVNRLVFDENKTAPGFSDKDKRNVKIIRTIKKDSWSTIILPCPMGATELTETLGNDVKVATFSGLSFELNDNMEISSIDLKFADYTGNLKAGVPYIIRTSQDSEEPYEFSFDNRTLRIVQTPELIKSKEIEDDDFNTYQITGTFEGTFDSKTIPNNGIFISGNKFWRSVGKTKTKGLRGWFNLDAAVGQDMSAAKINFIVDGEATAIDGVPSYKQVANGVYDLSGRKIQLKDGDLNKLQKGVYIIDGKKVTIK